MQNDLIKASKQLKPNSCLPWWGVSPSNKTICTTSRENLSLEFQTNSELPTMSVSSQKHLKKIICKHYTILTLHGQIGADSDQGLDSKKLLGVNTVDKNYYISEDTRGAVGNLYHLETFSTKHSTLLKLPWIYQPVYFLKKSGLFTLLCNVI